MQTIFKQKTSPLRARQVGVTLVELSIVMAIGGVLVITALLGVRKVIDSNNARQAVAQMGSALSAMTRTAQSLNDYSVYDDTIGLAKMGVFDPSSVVRSTVNGVTSISQVRNAFGGYVWTYRNAAGVDGVGPKDGLWYVIAGVPNTACGDVVSGVNNAAISVYVTNSRTDPLPDPAKLYIGTTPAAPKGSDPPKVKGGPMLPNNVESSCSHPDNSLKDIYVLTSI